MSHVSEQIVTIITAIVGVAILAVIFSKRSNTANVITAGANALSETLAVAVSPITGGAGIGPSTGFTSGTLSMPQLRGSF